VTCDPVGTGEIAERLDVEHQTVRAWKVRGLLPEERWTIGGRPVWDWRQDIQPWARETGRLNE
jgi:DNA-binding transcriptional MerR regulator